MKITLMNKWLLAYFVNCFWSTKDFIVFRVFQLRSWRELGAVSRELAPICAGAGGTTPEEDPYIFGAGAPELLDPAPAKTGAVRNTALGFNSATKFRIHTASLAASWRAMYPASVLLQATIGCF